LNPAISVWTAQTTACNAQGQLLGVLLAILQLPMRTISIIPVFLHHLARFTTMLTQRITAFLANSPASLATITLNAFPVQLVLFGTAATAFQRVLFPILLQIASIKLAISVVLFAQPAQKQQIIAQLVELEQSNLMGAAILTAPAQHIFILTIASQIACLLA
jgi:hypothetical protein